MHILVTNDDGIESPGIWFLAAALRDAGFGEVTIIAPEEEHSGTSMSFPIRLDHELYPVPPPDPAFAGIAAYALTGTPVGCVTAAMVEIVGQRPDVVVAGINPGLNAGTNVMLSGTVGAAMAGSMWGLPAMAVSAQYIRDQPMAWDVAAWAAARVFPILHNLRSPITPPRTILNVNVPNVPERSALRGFRQTITSPFFYGTFLRIAETFTGERGGTRFRYTFDRSAMTTAFDEQTDDGAIRAGYVSVTPLAPMAAHPQIDISPHLDGLLAG